MKTRKSREVSPPRPSPAAPESAKIIPGDGHSWSLDLTRPGRHLKACVSTAFLGQVASHDRKPWRCANIRVTSQQEGAGVGPAQMTVEALGLALSPLGGI